MRTSPYIIAYKFFSGLLEFSLGLGILLLGKKMFLIYQNIVASELIEDPNDLLVSLTKNIIPYFFEHRHYVILVLLILGSIKIAGAVGLYFHQHWGLDLLVGFTILLMPFDLYSLVSHFTLPKFVFLIIDIFIVLFLVDFKPKKYLKRFSKQM